MTPHRPPGPRIRAAAVLALCLFGRAALADDDEHAFARTPPLPAYQAECSGCHLAYPPGMLPAGSWRRLVDGLAQHYGTDASLDRATARAIADWLAANASNGPAPAADRITQSAAFVRRHREVPTATWVRPSVRNPANCSACHVHADQGVFDEHDVHIPR